MEKTKVDDMDLKLISVLQKNSRLSSTTIAKKVGVSTPTIIKKIERLEAKGIIEKFTIMLDHHKLGYKVIARVAMNILPSELKRVADLLKKEECLYEIWHMGGAHNLIAGARFKEVENLQKFTIEKLSKLPGIQSYEISIVLDVVKTTSP